MAVHGPGPYQLRVLSARLRAAGTEGQGLRRELYKAINDAARPLAAEISSAVHLAPYLPDTYAAVLASDLKVTAVKRGGANPGVSIQARGRAHRRKVIQLNEGTISHPLFGNRKRWFTQTAGMKAGFFTDPAERAAPDIRRQVLAAMHDIGQKITGG